MRPAEREGGEESQKPLGGNLRQRASHLLAAGLPPASSNVQQAKSGAEHAALLLPLERLLGLVNDDTTKYIERKSDLLAPNHEFSGEI